MKAIMKKVAKLKGVVLSFDDVLGCLDGLDFYLDEGEFTVSCDHEITVKVKGKVVSPKDLTISFEKE